MSILANADSLAREAMAAVIPRVAARFAATLCARAGLTRDAAGAEPIDVDAYVAQLDGRFGPPPDALLHYVLVGSRLGLKPTAEFDPAYYRLANPDVALDGYEPYAHFLRFGRAEGRAPTSDQALPQDTGGATLAELLDLHPPRSRAATIDVVMPVFGARDLTLAAIGSVLAAGGQTPYELVVVDDASPDPELADALDRLAETKLVTLLRNDSNLGFVRSVNRGMSLHSNRDVVLLNSDTRVFGDWLDRLYAALHSQDRIGSTTPLSNSATIFSYPIRLRDNPQISPTTAERIDAACARIAAPAVDVPTGVGFCMALRRRCLDQVGLFDADNFPRGYGEENDFCQRAIAAGWSHTAAANVYVWHRGGASFGGDRERLVRDAQETLHRLHPQYRATVRRFIAADPLAAARSAIDAALFLAETQAPRTLDAGMSPKPTRKAPLRLAPDIGRHSGSVRILSNGASTTVNLPRVGPETSATVTKRLLSDLQIDEVRTGARSQEVGAALRNLLNAATDAGIRLCTE